MYVKNNFNYYNLPLKLLGLFGADSLSECVFKSNCWITFIKITVRNLAGHIS